MFSFLICYPSIDRTIIPSLVSYWCETWPLTLYERHWLTVFHNRVLRRIFLHKWDEVRGDLGNCFTKNFVFRTPQETIFERWNREEWGETACGTYGRQDRGGACKVVGGNSVEQNLLLRPRRRWENIIQLDLQEIRGEHGLNWTDSGTGPAAWSIKYGTKHRGFIKCMECLEYVRKY